MDTDAEKQIKQLLDEIKTLRWSDYKRVIELGEQALELSRAVNHPLFIVKSLNAVGWGYNRLTMPVQSLKYAREATQLAKEQGFLEEYGYALVNLCFCYAAAGEFGETIHIIEQLIKLGEENNFYELLVFAYNDLSIQYIMASEYQMGLDMIQKSLDLINEHHVEIPKTFAYSNMAECYLMMNENERAIEVAHLAYEDAVKKDFAIGKTHSQRLLSSTYIATNNFEKGMYYAQKSLEASKETSQVVLASYFVAFAHSALGQFDEALKIYHEIHDYLMENAPIQLTDLYREMSKIYAQQGNYQLAYEHLQKSIDSFNQQAALEADKRIKILKTKYELDTAQREAQFQEAQKLMLQSEMEERLKRQRVEISLEKQLELMKIKNHILTRVNHEFRTPLTILRTSFELLSRYHERMTSEQRDEHVRRIEEQFQHINELLDDVLDAQLINDPNKQDVMITPINILNFAWSTVNLASQRTRTSDRVHMKIENLPDVIYQNEDLLEQIMVNLLTNAIKFSKDDVLLLLTSTPNDQLVISVKDFGIGIPPDEQESVFEVLTRGSNLDEVGGNGMGLALVKQSVEILRGQIKLESVLNVGTEFTVTLPLKSNLHSPTNAD